MLTPWKESYDQPRQHIKTRDIFKSIDKWAIDKMAQIANKHVKKTLV